LFSFKQRFNTAFPIRFIISGESAKVMLILEPKGLGWTITERL